MMLNQLSADDMQRKYTTVFKQLILNVVLPVVIALLILGIINYQQINVLLQDSNNQKSYLLSDEIQNIMKMQDATLSIFEEQLDTLLKNHSKQLIDEYFVKTDSIEKANLVNIRRKLGMDNENEDIYIINQQGIVVNTTYAKDLGLNFFSFGEEHKNLLLGILNKGEFVSERFAIEASTKRLKKYSYQPTANRKYIIEIGIYSDHADQIKKLINNRLTEITTKDKSVAEVDLFVAADDPFSLISGKTLDTANIERQKVLETFEKGTTQSYQATVNGLYLKYEYLFMQRENSTLYKNAVIKIVTDLGPQQAILRWELIKNLVLFGVTLTIVIVLIYRKTRVITNPIRKLVDSVIRISGGHFNERTDVEGNNEITRLSEQFNLMIATIQDYYNDLENKVRQRTAEIQQKTEEIAAQRDDLERQRTELAEKNEKLQEAYEEIDEKKKSIEDSIRYAKRIQTALLPSDHVIGKTIPNSFILFIPKDIVSGDFYWVSEYKGKILFSAVDCTGHGVPGAFMSLLGNNTLNNIIKQADNLTPAEILKGLSNGIASIFGQQEGGSTGLKDGMDVALCMLDIQTGELQYAGAFNPLWIVRNGQLTEIKPDKIPIGSSNDDTKTYTNHVIQLEKNDLIYIFSDGYVDQFGGPGGRKFMAKQMKEKLEGIHHLPMQEQKEILMEAHLTWRKSIKQVDDILVMGVRYL